MTAERFLVPVWLAFLGGMVACHDPTYFLGADGPQFLKMEQGGEVTLSPSGKNHVGRCHVIFNCAQAPMKVWHGPQDSWEVAAGSAIFIIASSDSEVADGVSWSAWTPPESSELLKARVALEEAQGEIHSLQGQLSELQAQLALLQTRMDGWDETLNSGDTSGTEGT